MTSNAWEEPVAGVELARSLEEWKRGKHPVGILKFKVITPLWSGDFRAVDAARGYILVSSGLAALRGG